MDAVAKYIVNVDWTVGLSTVHATLSSSEFSNRPGTMFGLHYDMTFHVTTAISNDSTVRWSILVVKNNQTPPTLETVQVNTVKDHLVNGDARMVLASGTANVWMVDILTKEGLVSQQIIQEKISGQVKTSRKMKAGDTLELIMLSDATLGVTVHGTFTFWKKS